MEYWTNPMREFAVDSRWLFRRPNRDWQLSVLILRSRTDERLWTRLYESTYNSSRPARDKWRDFIFDHETIASHAKRVVTLIPGLKLHSSEGLGVAEDTWADNYMCHVDERWGRLDALDSSGRKRWEKNGERRWADTTRKSDDPGQVWYSFISLYLACVALRSIWESWNVRKGRWITAQQSHRRGLRGGNEVIDIWPSDVRSRCPRHHLLTLRRSLKRWKGMQHLRRFRHPFLTTPKTTFRLKV